METGFNNTENLEMGKDNNSEIEKIIENAWKMFCEYYDGKVSEYAKQLKNDKKRANSHWICWNESDLMLQFGRFFYKELDKIDSKIEIHFDKNLNENNFKHSGYTFDKNLNENNFKHSGYTFAKKLPELKNNLGRYPKVDLIITPEDDYGPFLICGEAKYFHCSEESISRGGRTAEESIEKDFKTLSAIKKLGIAKNVVFIIFDDYYYYKEPEKSKNIENLLEKYNKEIKILYHDSHAKTK
ncbi:MAG: hypothetical protein CVT89_06260 [Candidatus Altiarchaeales archaeon HGW-Altiarchaeales-2]|nr:MAG: hypothetical protein CVT89_06260 [Candidatus Altiarchaeales archaeon HGW-Altiarchaeales-2]